MEKATPFVSFEERLVPHEYLREVAARNLSLIRQIGEGNLALVDELRFAVVTHLMGGPCQASCDFCATGMSDPGNGVNRFLPTDLRAEEAAAMIDEFAELSVGGPRGVRIAGAGEPMLSKPTLGTLLERAEYHQIPVISCTNSATIPGWALELFRKFPVLRLAVKVLSHNATVQNRILKLPKGQIVEYVDHPELGMVPKQLMELLEIARDRVGARVTVYRTTVEDAWEILRGAVPRLLPTYVDVVEEMGDGYGHGDELVSRDVIPTTPFMQGWHRWGLAIDRDGSLFFGNDDAGKPLNRIPTKAPFSIQQALHRAAESGFLVPWVLREKTPLLT